jgi:cytochrome P450
MRVYPPVWYMARVANEDGIVHGHAIPRGACVLLSAWFTQRDARFWEEPERFNPARFIGRAAGAQPRYAYFPFGGGRHQCLGMHFATLEGVQILAQLAQRFEIHPTAGREVRADPGITLRQNPFLQATITERSRA